MCARDCPGFLCFLFLSNPFLLLLHFAQASGDSSVVVASDATGSGGSTTTDDESPKAAHKLGGGGSVASKKRPSAAAQSHRRGKSISGNVLARGSGGSGLPSVAAAASGVPGAGTPSGVSKRGSVGYTAASSASSSSSSSSVVVVVVDEHIDSRHEIARYIHSLVAALHVMDKAASSLNELAGGADAAHKRLVDSEFAHHLQEAERQKIAPTKLRHRECIESPDKVRCCCLLFVVSFSSFKKKQTNKLG
jgi:hypothetical protein